MKISDLTGNKPTATGVVPQEEEAHLVPMYVDPAGFSTTYVGVSLDDGRFFRALPLRNATTRTIVDMVFSQGEVKVNIDPAAKLKYAGHGNTFLPVGEARSYSNQPFRPGTTLNAISGLRTPNRFDPILLATSASPGAPLTPSTNLNAFITNLISASEEERAAMIAWLPTAFRKSFKIEDGELIGLDDQGIVTIAAIESVWGASEEVDTVDTQNTTNPVDTFAA